jgi:hypothetical protein
MIVVFSAGDMELKYMYFDFCVCVSVCLPKWQGSMMPLDYVFKDLMCVLHLFVSVSLFFFYRKPRI